MSEYVSGTVEIRDCNTLVHALQDLGFAASEIEVHEQAQTLYGYKGDKRPETAHVIIRRQFVGGSSNDIGFVRHPDGRFTAIVSEFDQVTTGRHGPYGPAWLQRLVQQVGVVKAKQLAKKKALHVAKQETLANGSIVMTLRR